MNKMKDDNDLIGLRLKHRVGKARIAGYIRHNSAEYKILLDHRGEVMRLYRSKKIPAYYLTGKDGKVVWQKYGFAPRTIPMFDQTA